MPEEERSQNVTGQPNDQSPTQPPRQLPTNQQPPTTNTEDASNDDPDNSKTLQNDIRKGEYWFLQVFTMMRRRWVILCKQFITPTFPPLSFQLSRALEAGTGATGKFDA
jgi:hypothetical protein